MSTNKTNNFTLLEADLDSTLKNRDITLLTKVHLVKTMVFPVIMYGCEKELDHKESWSKVKSLNHVQLFATPWTVAYRLLRPWDFLGKNTGVSCHFLLHEIFPIQGLNLGLPHCRQILYHMSHQGSQRKLSAEELMLLNCGVGEDPWEPLGLQGDQTSQSKEVNPEYSLEGMMLKLRL